MRVSGQWTIVVLLLALVACSGESQLPVATGKGTIRAINAISTAPGITWRIEQRSLGTVEYKQWSSRQSYDDLRYTFNFEVFLAGDSTSTRVASQSLDVVKDTSYLITLTGQLAAPDVTVWERPEPALDAAGTVFEAQFGNLAPTLGSYDVYFAAPGTAPVLGEQQATVALGEISPVLSFDSGDFVLILTAVGDPGTVLFQSNTLTPAGGGALIFSTFDVDANDLGPVSVRAFNLATGVSDRVVDAGFLPELRFFHASLDGGPVDIYVDDPMTAPPLVEDHAFGDITTFLPVAGLTFPLTYTTADNVGSIRVSVEDRPSLPGLRSHIFFIENSAGEDALIDYVLDRRSVETQARLSIVNTASIGLLFDIYLIASGGTLDDTSVPIAFSYPPGLDPLVFNFLAGSYDLYITPEDDVATVLAGPVPIDLAYGDVLEAHLLATPDPNVVDVRLFTP